MGLDIYLSRTAWDVTLTSEDRAALDGLRLPLCEWSGRGSFRGKVYLDVVDEVAGLNLGEEWTPPEEVARMAAAFEACDPDEVARASDGAHYAVSADDARALRHLFRLCADRGIGLVGSW